MTALPAQAHSSNLTVGQAQTMLDSLKSDLFERPEVKAVGVGLRDDRTAFIVTVSDLDARKRFIEAYPKQYVGDLPLVIDVSSICEASRPITGCDYIAHSKPRTMANRISLVWRRLSSLLAP